MLLEYTDEDFEERERERGSPSRSKRKMRSDVPLEVLSLTVRLLFTPTAYDCPVLSFLSYSTAMRSLDILMGIWASRP